LISVALPSFFQTPVKAKNKHYIIVLLHKLKLVLQDLLLITPPFTQLNTPYPATAYIKGFLNTKQISSFQMDLGIEVILALFSKKGISDLFQKSDEVLSSISDPNIHRISALRQYYISTIDDVIRFLQGHNKTLARQICSDNFLPRASKPNI